MQKKVYINVKLFPELDMYLLRRGKLTFRLAVNLFLISLIVIPSYFGVRLVFFDLTALRLCEIIIIYMILSNQQRRIQFFHLFIDCKHTIWIGLYFFVVVYTNLYHPSINTIFYWLTNGIFVFYIIAYIIKYIYSIEEFLEIIRKLVFFICIVSLIELIIGQSPFLYFNTLGKEIGSSIRFGDIRIKGPCWEANSYGMFLMIFFPLFCYDYKSKCISFSKNLYLLVLIALNVLLTGSRLSVGIIFLSLTVVFVAQNRKRFFNSLILLLVMIPIIVFILYIFRDVDIIKGLLRTIFSGVDEVLGTEYALNFGADAKMLFDSSYYRELLFKHTILDDWLNPWMGRGGNYQFGMFIENYRIYSVDNFYVGQYITYAYPGLVTWLAMSFSFLKQMLHNILIKHDKLSWVLMVSFVCYFISLWYLDQLQTFQIMFIVFALTYGIDMDNG